MLNDISLLTTIGSVCLGTFLGLVGNALSISRDQKGWKIALYILGCLTLTYAMTYGIVNRHIMTDFSSSQLYIVIGSFVSGAVIIFFTKAKLDVKSVFTTAELNPIVNSFTEKADRKEIKLFGGDLNFFGNSKKEMEQNPQYTHLRGLSFSRVLVLCESPKDIDDEVRYGKILTDMPQAELRFYKPAEADLKVRGRIIEVQGISKLLMYNKIKSKTYEAIETDRANAKGELYHNIWELVWSLAIKPTEGEIDSYKKLIKT